MSRLVTVVSQDEAWRTAATVRLASRGWRVTETATIGSDALASAAPVAILIEGRPAMLSGWQFCGWRDGAVVIAVGEPGSAAGLRHDARIGRACVDHALARLGIDRPPSLPAATQRLRAVFGDAAIQPLLNGFAVLLAEASAALGSPEGSPLAHRVAGMAGTLGFEELGQRWLAASERDGSPVDRIRVASRMAIGAIRREVPQGAC